MGYDTVIKGRFNLDKALSAEHKAYLQDFADARHAGGDFPGIWCQWIPTEDGMGIEFDQGEKFYSYTPWLVYIIDNFLKPWGYVLNGNVSWQGERHDDIGRIWVKNNVVKAVPTKLLNDEPDWGDNIPEPLDEVDPAPNPIEDIIADGLMLDDQ